MLLVKSSLNYFYTMNFACDADQLDNNKTKMLQYAVTVKVDSNRVQRAQIIAPTYEVITTDSNGDAVFNNVPFDETNAPTIYYNIVLPAMYC